MDSSKAVSEMKNYLVSTHEFRNLRKARLIIKKNQNYEALLQSYNKKQRVMCNDKLSEAQLGCMFKDMSTEYEKLNQIPEVCDYFRALESFGVLVDRIITGVNLDIEEELN